MSKIKEHSTSLSVNNSYPAESIEEKMRRAIENNDPIEADTSVLQYTKRSDGILPEFDIRTDKWDIAMTQMGVVNKARAMKIAENTAKSNGETLKTQPETTQTTE